MRKPKKIVTQAEYNLPAPFNREIGKIMVRWAYFENIVQRVNYSLLGVSQKIGRIAVREPRIDGRLEMILDLSYLTKIPIPEEPVKELIARANELLLWRNLIAHGIWIPNEGGR